MEFVPTELAMVTVPGLHEFLAAGAFGDYEAGHVIPSFE
jgi:hypothetical protein